MTAIKSAVEGLADARLTAGLVEAGAAVLKEAAAREAVAKELCDAADRWEAKGRQPAHRSGQRDQQVLQGQGRECASTSKRTQGGQVTDTITKETGQLGGFDAPGQAEKPRRAHRRGRPLPPASPEYPANPPSGFALSVANSRRSDGLRRLRVELESLQRNGPRQVQTMLSAGMYAIGARQAEQNRQAEADLEGRIARVEDLDGWPLVVEFAQAQAEAEGYRGSGGA